MGMRFVEANIEGFGQYRNRQIVFSEGLNVIYGHNESGKTTLMKFIEGILYGFYKPAQRRQYTADYEKYRPWDGGSYGGTLVYETEGQYVAVHRDFEKDEVQMWDVATKEDLTKELPYNEFYRQWEPAARDFKISAAAFRNTISIVQGKASADLSQVGRPPAMKRSPCAILYLICGSNGNKSAAKARRRIRSWGNSLYGRKR